MSTGSGVVNPKGGSKGKATAGSAKSKGNARSVAMPLKLPAGASKGHSPATPSGSEKASTGSRVLSMAAAGVHKGGLKRSRDQSASGMTPPAKRPQKKHSYAEAAKGSLELVIVKKDEGHISAKDFHKLNQEVEDEWLHQLDKGDVPFNVEMELLQPLCHSVGSE